MHHARPLRAAATAAVLLLSPIACRDAGGPAARNLSLSFATLGSAAASTPLTLTDGAHTLTITSAEVVLSRIELATSSTTNCAEDTTEHSDDHASDRGDDGEDRCEEVALGPMAVALPVDASVVTALAVDIPPGMYEALEARIRAARAADAGAAGLLAAHPELAGASVRVTGTFDGTPFTYSGAPEAELELRFDPPLAVASGPTNVTVHVSIADWFRDGAGALVNPGTANAGEPNADLVARNIAESFRAFRDDERRGDDGRDGGDGHDGHGDGGG